MPSVNDNWASATDIALTGTGTFTSATTNTTTNTSETGEPSNGSSSTRSAWWKFTPTVNGTLLVKANATNSHSVYTGAAVNALTLVGTASTSISANTFGTAVPLVAGTTYYIQVGNTNTSTLTVTMEYGTAPANDNWANAIDIGLTGYGTYTSGTTDVTHASTEVGEPSSGSSSTRSIWYKFTPTVTGNLAIKGNFSVRTSVYSGSSLATLTRLIGSDMTPAGGSYGQGVRLTAGTTYYIQIGLSNQSTLTVTLDYVAVPANDDWANATDLGVTGYGFYQSAPADTTHASIETSEPQAPTYSIWYKFTPSVDGAVNYSNDWGGRMSIYTGSSLATLTQLVTQAMSPGVYSTNAQRVTAGTTYYIQLIGVSATAVTTNLDFGAAYANDDFANAQLIDMSPGWTDLTNVSTQFATVQPGEQGASGSNTRTRWYKYVPLTSGTLNLDRVGGSLARAVWTGTTLGSLTLVGSGSSTYLSVAVTGGTTYWIQLGYNGITTSTIQLSGPASASPPIAMGQATETDTAQPFTVGVPSTTVSMGQAVETDAAQSITPRTIILMGQAVETDTANRIAPLGVVFGIAQPLALAVGAGTLEAPEGATLTILDPTQVRAPTSVQVTISNAEPSETFTFSIDGTEVATVDADVEGNIDVTSIAVDDDIVTTAGTHTLTATGDGSSGTVSADFTLARNSQLYPTTPPADADPVFIAASQTGDRFHWVLQDLAPGGLGSWVMPISPTSMSNPHVRKNLDVSHTTSPAEGVYHITEGHLPPMDWQFAGYCPDQAFYNQLVAYANLKRRLYVIDHRSRAWAVAIAGVDLKPRKRQHDDDGTWNDWAHDYTVSAFILDEDWKVPVS